MAAAPLAGNARLTPSPALPSSKTGTRADGSPRICKRCIDDIARVAGRHQGRAAPHRVELAGSMPKIHRSGRSANSRMLSSTRLFLRVYRGARNRSD